MAEKVYLNLLLLCGIFSQEIFGNLAHENINGTSDILVRQKRVISRIPGEDQKVTVQSVPYIVHIKYHMRIICVGSILSRHVVITSSEYVQNAPTEYILVSRTARSSRGEQHSIQDIRRKFGNHPNRPGDGIALLKVSRIDLGAYARPIKLHSEPLLPGTVGTISGWGFNYREENRGTEHPLDLRSIEVPIMAHRECKNIYRPHNIEISDKDICIYHPQRLCGHTDGGAPLVVDGYLVGIYLWAGPDRRQMHCSYPEVFALLQHLEYNQWITSNVRNMEANF